MSYTVNTIDYPSIKAITAFTAEYFSLNSFDSYDEDGASKACHLLGNDKPFVLKYSICPSCDEVMRREALIYEEVPLELKKFFAKEFCLGTFTDINGEKAEVYCQERVETIAAWEDDKCDNFSERIHWLYRDWDCHWGGNFMRYLIESGESEKICRKLNNFLAAYDINDIHNGNWGFRKDGSPVLFDYSGYHDEGEYESNYYDRSC